MKIETCKQDTQSNSVDSATLEDDLREFNNWFDKSQVVDETGDPLVMYHGTGVEHEGEFHTNTYFTSDAKYASTMSAQSKNDSARHVIPVFLALRNIAKMDDYRAAKSRLSANSTNNDVFSALQDAGFDGFAPFGSTAEIVVFSPLQIRSALQTRSTIANYRNDTPIQEDSKTPRPSTNSRDQKTPVGSRWQANGDSRVFVVSERNPFGKVTIKQEGRMYFGEMKQKDLLKTFTRLPNMPQQDALDVAEQPAMGG